MTRSCVLPRLHLVLVVGNDAAVDVVSATRLLCRLLLLSSSSQTRATAASAAAAAVATTSHVNDAGAATSSSSIDAVLAHMREVRRALAVSSGAVEFDVRMTVDDTARCVGVTTTATATTTDMTSSAVDHDGRAASPHVSPSAATASSNTEQQQQLPPSSAQTRNSNSNNSSAARKSTTTTAAAIAAAEAETAARQLQQQRQAYLRAYLPPYECVCVRPPHRPVATRTHDTTAQRHNDNHNGNDNNNHGGQHAATQQTQEEAGAPVLFLYELCGQAQLLGGGGDAATLPATTTTTATATTATTDMCAAECARAFVQTVAHAWHAYTQQRSHATDVRDDTDVVVVWAVTDVRLLRALTRLRPLQALAVRTLHDKNDKNDNDNDVDDDGSGRGNERTRSSHAHSGGSSNTSTTHASSSSLSATNNNNNAMTSTTRTASRAGGRPHSAASHADKTSTTAAATTHDGHTRALSAQQQQQQQQEHDDDQSKTSVHAVSVDDDAVSRCCAHVRVVVRVCAPSTRSGSSGGVSSVSSNSNHASSSSRETGGMTAADDSNNNDSGSSNTAVRRSPATRKSGMSTATTSSPSGGSRAGNATSKTEGNSNNATAMLSRKSNTMTRTATTTPSSSPSAAASMTVADVYNTCTSVAQLVERLQQLSRQHHAWRQQRRHATLPRWYDDDVVYDATSVLATTTVTATAPPATTTDSNNTRTLTAASLRSIGTPLDVFLYDEQMATTTATTTTRASRRDAAVPSFAVGEPVWLLLDVGLDSARGAYTLADVSACQAHVVPTIAALVANTADYSAWRRTRTSVRLPVLSSSHAAAEPSYANNDDDDDDAHATAPAACDGVYAYGYSLTTLSQHVSSLSSSFSCDMRRYARVRRATAATSATPQRLAGSVAAALLAQAAVSVARMRPLLLVYCPADTTATMKTTAAGAMTTASSGTQDGDTWPVSSHDVVVPPMRLRAYTSAMHDDGRGTCSVRLCPRRQQQQHADHDDNDNNNNSSGKDSIVATTAAVGDKADYYDDADHNDATDAHSVTVATAAEATTTTTCAPQRRRACAVTHVHACCAPHDTTRDEQHGGDDDNRMTAARLEAVLQRCVVRALGVCASRDGKSDNDDSTTKHATTTHTTATAATVAPTTTPRLRGNAHTRVSGARDTARDYVTALAHTLQADDMACCGDATAGKRAATTTAAAAVTNKTYAPLPPSRSLLPLSSSSPRDAATTPSLPTLHTTSERVCAFVLRRGMLDALAVLAGVVATTSVIAAHDVTTQSLCRDDKMSGRRHDNSNNNTKTMTPRRRLPVRCADEAMTSTAMYTRMRDVCERFGPHLCTIWRCINNNDNKNKNNNNNNNNNYNSCLSYRRDDDDNYAACRLWLAGMHVARGREQRRVWLHHVSGAPSPRQYAQCQHWLQRRAGAMTHDDGGGHTSTCAGLPHAVVQQLLHRMLSRRDCLQQTRCHAAVVAATTSTTQTSDSSDSSSVRVHDVVRDTPLRLLAEGRRTFFPHTDAVMELTTTRCRRACSYIAADELIATLHFSLPRALLDDEDDDADDDDDDVRAASVRGASPAATTPRVHLSVRYDDGVLLTCEPQQLPAAAVVEAMVTTAADGDAAPSTSARTAALPPIGADGDVRLRPYTTCATPTTKCNSSHSSCSKQASARASRVAPGGTTAAATTCNSSSSNSRGRRYATIPRMALTVASQHCVVHTRDDDGDDDGVVWVMYDNQYSSSSSDDTRHEATSRQCTPATQRPCAELVYAVREYAGAASRVTTSLAQECARSVHTRSGVVTRYFASPRRVVQWQKLYPSGAVCTRVAALRGGDTAHAHAESLSSSSSSAAVRRCVYCDTLSVSSGARYVRRVYAACSRRNDSNNDNNNNNNNGNADDNVCDDFVRLAEATEAAVQRHARYDACEDCHVVSRRDGVRVATYFARHAHKTLQQQLQQQQHKNDNDTATQVPAVPALRVTVHADGTSIATLLQHEHGDGDVDTTAAATTASAVDDGSRSCRAGVAEAVRSATASLLLREARDVAAACARTPVRWLVESPYTPRIFACRTTTTTATTMTACQRDGNDHGSAQCDAAFYIVFRDGSVLKRHAATPTQATTATTTTQMAAPTRALRSVFARASGTVVRVLHDIGVVVVERAAAARWCRRRAAALAVGQCFATFDIAGGGVRLVDAEQHVTEVTQLYGGGNRSRCRRSSHGDTCVHAVDDAVDDDEDSVPVDVSEDDDEHGGGVVPATTTTMRSRADVRATMQSYTWHELLRQLVRPSYTTHRQSRAQLARQARLVTDKTTTLRDAGDTAVASTTLTGACRATATTAQGSVDARACTVTTTAAAPPPSLLLRLRRLAEPLITAHELLRPDVLHSLAAADHDNDDDGCGSVAHDVAPLYFVERCGDGGNDDDTAAPSCAATQLLCAHDLCALRHAVATVTTTATAATTSVSDELATHTHCRGRDCDGRVLSDDDAAYMTDTPAAGDPLVRQLTVYDSDSNNNSNNATWSSFHCGVGAVAGTCDVYRSHGDTCSDGYSRNISSNNNNNTTSLPHAQQALHARDSNTSTSRHAQRDDARADVVVEQQQQHHHNDPRYRRLRRQQQQALVRASGTQWLPPTLQPAPHFCLHRRARASARVDVDAAYAPLSCAAHDAAATPHDRSARVCRVLLHYADARATSPTHAASLLQCVWQQRQARHDAAKANAALTYNSAVCSNDSNSSSSSRRDKTRARTPPPPQLYTNDALQQAGVVLQLLRIACDLLPRRGQEA